MSYSKLSRQAARYISRELKFDDEKEQIIAYSIENLILGLAGFILIIVVGALFNAALPAAIAAIFGAVLRRLSGGAHAKTAFRCLVFGSIAYGLIGVVSKYLVEFIFGSVNSWFLFIPLVGALFLVSIYAPVDCKAKPIKSKSLKKNLKLASISFVFFSLIVSVLSSNLVIKCAVALGILYQSVTLLPIFNRKGGE